MQENIKEKGLLLVYTGKGKGKTTAALGLCMRAAGWKQKICVIQFLKSEDFECGERIFCRENNIEFYSTGVGYSWTKTHTQQREALKRAWRLTNEKVMDSSYDLVVLDEIINVFHIDKFVWQDIINEKKLIALLDKRPFGMNVVCTGRNASNQFIEYADLVTEMMLICHHYEKGNKARKAIEY